MNLIRVSLFAFCTLIGMDTALAGSGGRATSEITAALKATFEAPQSSRDPAFPVQRLKKFYEARQYEPLWFEGGMLSPKAQQLLTWIGKSSEHGLQPEWYNGRLMQAQLPKLKEVRVKTEHAQKAAELEIKISDAYVNLSEDLQVGRLDPRNLKRTAANDPGGANAAASLQVITSADVDSRFRAAVRVEPEYKALQKRLAELRQIQKDGGWPHIPRGKPLRVGVTDRRVGLIRKRLGVTAKAKNRFDEKLAKSVREFQKGSGLRASGVVDDGTVGALNLPLTEAIRKLQVNLERIRWIPREPPQTHVLVDLAGFTLTLKEEGVPKLNMKVIIGQSGWKTPIFSSQISYLVVNPTWTAPVSIAQEILPKILDDADYLKKMGFRVFPLDQKNGKELDPATVDWASLEGKPFPYRLVQSPGGANPMGNVKFMFPNEFDVYLHDTPADQLFSRPVRAFSHGCVRLEKPLDLAVELLKYSKDPMTKDQLQKLVDAGKESGKETVINLTENIPVFLLYRTAWAEANGSVNFRRDIYGLDDTLWKALNLSDRRLDGFIAEDDTELPVF